METPVVENQARPKRERACMQETMSFEVPTTDTIYIGGLPPDTTEASLAEYFGSIGIIKLDKKTKGKKIWLYRDKGTGEL